MKHLQKLYEQVCLEQEHHADEIFNYVIPEAWNLYGFTDGIPARHKEIIVNPYAFTKFTLEHILNEQEQNRKSQNWYKESVIYYQITRLATAWNHDRTQELAQDNLYHLNDHGTFLKAMLRLPYYRRLGINTIILSSPFALGKDLHHTFPKPYAVKDFNQFDETLKDPLVKQISLKEEYLAFEECAHHLGFHIIWQLDMGTMARDNMLIKTHPDWFYWIDKGKCSAMHAPQIPFLSQNCPPDEELLAILNSNEDVVEQNTYFHDAPKAGLTLPEIEKQYGLTTVPFLHDRINSVQPVEDSYTPLRFYMDTIYTHPAILRADLFPGKKKNKKLWTYLKQILIDLQTNFNIDGFYFTRIYLLPEELLHSFIKLVKAKQQVMIMEDTQEHFHKWKQLQVDGISGDSAYVAYDVWNHQLHNFAYRLKDHPLPVFSAAEFLDTPRLPQYGNQNLITLLHVLPQFLPNSVPLYMNGMECGEKQPLMLSYFQDQNYQNALDQTDPRYMKQPMLDGYYFEYRDDAIYTISPLLERISAIRLKYIDAITDNDACLPLWFDSPLDQGIGFAYCKDDSILIVIANTNIDQYNTLCTHLETLYAASKPMTDEIRQIFSTKDPFVYDVTLDEFHNLRLNFAPGEVKFLELTQLK